jgi:hypothetical protein
MRSAHLDALTQRRESPLFQNLSRSNMRALRQNFIIAEVEGSHVATYNTGRRLSRASGYSAKTLRTKTGAPQGRRPSRCITMTNLAAVMIAAWTIAADTFA